MTVATAERPKTKAQNRSATAARTATPKARTAPDIAAQTRATIPTEASARRIGDCFKQLSDPTRLRVLLMLAEREMHVGALCERLGIGQPACSHHLALLRHGGFIVPRRDGKHNYYGLTEEKGVFYARMARDAPW